MKRLRKIIPVSVAKRALVLGVAAFGGACLFLTPASANLISVNISSIQTGGSAIDGEETFGVPAEETVVTNWNNVASFSTRNNLIRSDGTVSGVQAITRNGGGELFWGAAYVNTPWNYGVAHYTSTTGSVSMQFNNLNEEFPFGFYAIVYVNGAPANSGAAISDGTTTYYFQTANPSNTAPIRITDTVDNGIYLVGNYAVFGSGEAALTADSITFRIPTGSVVANNVGIGGVQLVAIPEPSTTALLIGSVALTLLLMRRRRFSRVAHFPTPEIK